MPVYTLRFVNSSFSNQDWMLSTGNNFLLVPRQVAILNVDVNANRTIVLAVSTDGGVTAANLVYTAATRTWALNTHTPREWTFIEANTIVTARCLLEDIPQPAGATFGISEPTFEMEPA